MHRIRWLASVLTIAVVGNLGVLGAEARKLAVLPGKIALSNVESRQTIIVQWQNDDEFEGQAVKGHALQSSDEAVVRIEEGKATPVGNGKATITASVARSRRRRM